MKRLRSANWLQRESLLGCDTNGVGQTLKVEMTVISLAYWRTTSHHSVIFRPSRLNSGGSFKSEPTLPAYLVDTRMVPGGPNFLLITGWVPAFAGRPKY